MAKKNKLENISVKEVFSRIIWPKRGMLLFGLVLILLRSAATIIPPKATQYLIDDVVIDGDLQELKLTVGLIVLAIIVQAVTSFTLTRILSVQAQKLIAKLRVQVQKKILSLPINFFDSQKSGALVSRIMTDVEGVRNLVGTGFVQLIGGAITAVAVLFILINTNAKLTALIVLPIILFGVIAMKAFGVLRPEFRKRGKLNAEVTGRLTETLNGVRVIKGFGAEQQEIKIFEKGVDSSTKW